MASDESDVFDEPHERGEDGEEAPGPRWIGGVSRALGRAGLGSEREVHALLDSLATMLASADRRERVRAALSDAWDDVLARSLLDESDESRRGKALGVVASAVEDAAKKLRVSGTRQAGHTVVSLIQRHSERWIDDLLGTGERPARERATRPEGQPVDGDGDPDAR